MKIIPAIFLQGGVVLAAAVLLFCGCKKNSYRADRFYEAGGKSYAFTVAVEKETLYISGMVDGKPINGSSGESVPEGKFSRVEVADLNNDGEPEIYAFSPRSYSWSSGLYAYSCSEAGCVAIGMENAPGGHPPGDYCGEDAFNLKDGALVRQYTVCPVSSNGPKKLGYIRYTLIKNSFGLVLKS